MSVGRNEQCPCGSGKKYKKCCGIVTTIAEARNMREEKLRKEFHASMERLNKFVASHVSAEELQAARERFASAIGIHKEEVLRSEWIAHFLNWYMFDVQTNGTRIIDQFLKQHGRKLESEIRHAFEHMQLGAYEVEETKEDGLAVHDLGSGKKHEVRRSAGVNAQPGEILIGRLVSLGHRDMLMAGSIILKPVLKPAILERVKQPTENTVISVRTTDLYRVIVQSGAQQPPGQSPLIRRLYRNLDTADIRNQLEAHGSFELKKRDNRREIWVYSKRKEAHLFPALHDALLELHEVGGEVLLEEASLAVEAPLPWMGEIAAALSLPDAAEEGEISHLTSTGSKLTPGTLFITSEPSLPSRVLQWAVQTYFAEKWLSTPHQALNGLPPILAAASADQTVKEALSDLVETIEEEGKRGNGLARFMRIDFLRPRLSLANSQLHISNLLQRPMIVGMPDSEYTVTSDTLADIAAFAAEMTEGKSEATIKKYDEAMNLFRSFVRGAFGAGFTWDQLRKEEIAYFLTHDIPERTDSLTKTLANNVLSVLAAFFKWVDKRERTDLSGEIQPLLSALKDDLSESYRLRSLLQKEANHHLADQGTILQEAVEEHLILLERRPNGWLCKRENGDSVELLLPEDAAATLAPDWITVGLIGHDGNGTWRLYSTPELYPPVISELLGVQSSVLI
jgi:hypothetical protein